MADLIAFIVVAVYMILVYIPFMKHCIKAYKSVDNDVFKKAFLSLTIMSLSFTLILICQLIDRIYIIGGSDGYTIFYFMGWSFALIGMIGAYFGYIKPKTAE